MCHNDHGHEFRAGCHTDLQVISSNQGEYCATSADARCMQRRRDCDCCLAGGYAGAAAVHVILLIPPMTRLQKGKLTRLGSEATSKHAVACQNLGLGQTVHSLKFCGNRTDICDLQGCHYYSYYSVLRTAVTLCRVLTRADDSSAPNELCTLKLSTCAPTYQNMTLT